MFTAEAEFRRDIVAFCLLQVKTYDVEDIATIDLHLILCTLGLMYNPEFFSILQLKKSNLSNVF